MADETPAFDDPMALVGVEVPAAGREEMAACVVEEYVRAGWDDEALLGLFRDPFYGATHRIYQELGESRVLELIRRARAVWGWPVRDAPGTQRGDGQGHDSGEEVGG